MKNVLTLHLLSFILILSCTNPKEAKTGSETNPLDSAYVKIKGEVNVFDGTVVKIMNEDFEKVYIIDTVVNKQFKFELSVPGNGFYFMNFTGTEKFGNASGWFHGNRIYLEDGHSYMFKASSANNILSNVVNVISSSKIQQSFSKFEEPYWKKLSDLNTQLEQNEALAAKLFEQNRKKEYEEVRVQVLKDENYLQQLFPLEYIREFATNNPSTFISAYKLLGAYDLKENYNAYLDIYNRLSPDVKHHQYGILFKEKLDALSKIADGKPFPLVAGKSLSGEKYAYSFKDKKLVFVDFWASWCIPCREANPELVDLYKRYHPKGFDVISISLDTNIKLWNAAVVKDNLIWPNHFSDLKKFGESYNSITYDVSSIPQNYILDHNGRILARNVEIDSLKIMLDRITE